MINKIAFKKPTPSPKKSSVKLKEKTEIWWEGVVVYQVVFSVFQKERSPVGHVLLNQESLVDMFCRYPPVIFGEGSMFGSP